MYYLPYTIFYTLIPTKVYASEVKVPSFIVYKVMALYYYQFLKLIIKIFLLIIYKSLVQTNSILYILMGEFRIID